MEELPLLNFLYLNVPRIEAIYNQIKKREVIVNIEQEIKKNLYSLEGGIDLQSKILQLLGIKLNANVEGGVKKDKVYKTTIAFKYNVEQKLREIANKINFRRIKSLLG